jgi:hypothetical protein
LTLPAGAQSTSGCRNSDSLGAEGTVIGPEQAAHTRAAGAIRVRPAVSAETAMLQGANRLVEHGPDGIDRIALRYLTVQRTQAIPPTRHRPASEGSVIRPRRSPEGRMWDSACTD